MCLMRRGLVFLACLLCPALSFSQHPKPNFSRATAYHFSYFQVPGRPLRPRPASTTLSPLPGPTASWPDSQGDLCAQHPDKSPRLTSVRFIPDSCASMQPE